MERDAGDGWDQLRRRVYRRDDWHCQCCGRRGNRGGDAELHAHHIHERAEGGADEERNLLTLCDRCHAVYHENPHLLEEGPPVSPSAFARLKDWLLIDVLSIRSADTRSPRRSAPDESEERQAWREEGLVALETLSRERSEPDGLVTRLFGSADDSPPRLYTAGSGGLLARCSDETVNERYGGCPECGRDALTADWIEWETRGSAKRVRCTSCEALFEAQVVGRNGRRLVTLDPVPTVFELETVASPGRYELQRPELTLAEFDDHLGTDCPACGSSDGLHYGLTWRRADLLPRRRWTCEECGARFLEGDGEYRRIGGDATADPSATSPRWYYLIGGIGVLALAVGLLDPRLIPLFGPGAALAVYNDVRYVHARSDQRPSTRFWVWATILTSTVGAVAYLATRKATDDPDSELHSGRLRKTLWKLAARFGNASTE